MSTLYKVKTGEIIEYSGDFMGVKKGFATLEGIDAPAVYTADEYGMEVVDREKSIKNISEIPGIDEILKEKVRAVINSMRDEGCNEPVAITLESDEEALFSVSGNAKFDISEAVTMPELFPQSWRCENGTFEVTHEDMATVKAAYISRRSELVRKAGELKDNDLSEMTTPELLNWLAEPSL